MSENRNNRVSRVAVVAIHGVADQKPHDTAHRIAHLLLHHQPERYTAFAQTDVLIGVSKTHIEGKEDWKQKRPNLWQFNPTGECMGALDKPTDAKSQAEIENPRATEQGCYQRTPALEYMREQLAAYTPTGDDAIYETIQLNGIRAAQNGNGTPVAPHHSDSSGTGPCEVHIFENYWADLSRAPTTVLRLLADFYQLLFYLCTLGRHTIKFARARFRDSRKQILAWRWFGNCQFVAEQSLVLAVPVLNLCLLGLTTVTLPSFVPARAQPAMALAATALLAAISVGIYFYAKRYEWFKPDGGRWWRGALVVLGSAAGASFLIHQVFDQPGELYRYLSLICWFIAAALILWIMLKFQNYKPGASWTGLIGLIVVSSVLLWGLWQSAGTPGQSAKSEVVHAALFTAEVVFVLICCSWFVYGIGCIGARIAGRWAVWVAGRDRKEEACRADWTVHLTLVLPAIVSALVNVALWTAIYLMFNRLKVIPADVYAPQVLDPWLKTGPVASIWIQLLELSVGPYFLIGFSFAALFVLLALLSLIPVIISEISVPRRRQSLEPAWLGRCLDRWFHVARFSGESLWIVILFVPLILASMCFDTKLKDFGQGFRTASSEFLMLLGSVFVTLVIGSQLKFNQKAPTGLRTLVDIALDVANWFRLHPVDRNPKARIVARFVSLLRHLCHWRGPSDGLPYNAIVIIAHSQGTVIAADVLRFLQVERDPTLGRLYRKDLPIYLFTMGSPLRQLYSLRFPHQYGWAGLPDQQQHAWPGSVPDPQELAVRHWRNAYRSGDYVGRYLWFNDQDQHRFGPTPDPRPDRSEVCIGPGAHNHYWDESASEIAFHLDLLIQAAAAERPSQQS